MSTASNFILWPEVPGHNKSSTYALHAQLLFTQWMQPDRIQYLQLRQLENLLRFAGRYSPWWAGDLKFLETLPVGGLYAEHLAQVPVMSRESLQKNSQKIIIRRRLSNHGRSRMARISKHGGPPFKMMVTGLIDAWNDALVLRSLDWSESDVSIDHVRILPATDNQKSGSMKRGAILPWSGPIHVISAVSPSTDQLHELMRINPGSLQTEPQILEALLEQALLEGSRPQNLREIRCRGAWLDPELRKLAEKAWGIPIIHEYFLEEIGSIALQCPENPVLHIHSEFVFVEILNEHDKPCTAGQTGRVVVTPLQNFQTPLIRYDTGNLAEAGGVCDCGRTLPVLNGIFK
jgi:phenylacetate-CoA ligase